MELIYSINLFVFVKILIIIARYIDNIKYIVLIHIYNSNNIIK